MGQEHELSFCHICCENLNVLTKDRKTYSKTELQQHMQGKNRGEDGFHGKRWTVGIYVLLLHGAFGLVDGAALCC